MHFPKKIRGRIVDESDIDLIRSLIEKHKDKSRNYISGLLAQKWKWYQYNGRLKDRACRDILSILERHGLIILPPLQTKGQNIVKRQHIIKNNISIDDSTIKGALNSFLPLSFKMVCQSPSEDLWNHLMRSYHYLGYTNIAGSHLKYLVYTNNGRLVAVLGWGSAVWKLESRDRAIGWTINQREEFLHKVANNQRFLILPWVGIKYLASHVLSKNVRILNRDWFKRYGYKLSLLETFVDPTIFKGVSYRAANWIYVGRTKGFSKNGNSFNYHGNRKEVFLYPLSRNFRQELGCNNDHIQPLSTAYYLSLEKNKKPKRSTKMILLHKGWNRQLPPPIDLTEEDIESISEEFEQFHSLFDKSFYRIEQKAYSRCYLQGLMSPLERKSMEPIALNLLAPKNVRSLQHFLSAGKWNIDDLAGIHKQEAAKVVADPLGVLSVDGSDFPKKGKESVAVTRQYCGILGKVDNCQAGVFLAYSGPKGYALLDRRLFIPEVWFKKENEERWEKCEIPENTEFKTKIQLAAEMINDIQENGLFPTKWITCDDFFGRDSKFLDNLPDDLNYLADIPGNTRVWTEQPQTEIPLNSGRGRKPKKAKLKNDEPGPVKVSEIAKLPTLKWKTIILEEGAKGPILADVTRIRVIESRDQLPGEKRWLFIRRSVDSKEINYFISNAPLETLLEEMCRVSTLRWPVEQLFKEGKNELGMDHYEHRSWIAWHRHMTFVFLAQLFLLKLRLKFKKNASFNFITGNDSNKSCITHTTI